MGLNQLLCKNDDEGVEMRGSELLAIIQVSINQAKRDSMFATAQRLRGRGCGVVPGCDQSDESSQLAGPSP